MYSSKCTGAYRSRSLMNLEPVDRYIAPPDFISRVSNGINIEYNVSDALKRQGDGPAISTMSMLALAYQLDYTFKTDFPSRPIWTMTADINADIDVYQTVYYPDPMATLYRVSITGRRLIAEFVIEPTVDTKLTEILFEDFGIEASLSNRAIHSQTHGKLLQTDKKAAQDFISWASKKHNIYSLGRWGTHRQLLMDDVVHDLKVIDNLIESNQYRR
tara:strand:- start:405 stop:1052 length:648 start_codon:yes stop_codon:yes gene_type:complete